MWFPLPYGKISFEELKQNLPKCRLCADLYDIPDPRPFVFGNQRVKIFQISQAPSYSVHLSGKPFDDQSGETLRRWYGISKEQFYNQDNFYMTSISHCYPGKTPKGQSRKPSRFCAQIWLKRELELVETEIYIVIGAIAASYFFKDNFNFLPFRDDLTINGKPAYVLPHPSPLNHYWLERYFWFEEERIPQIQQIIKRTLGINQED